MVRKGTIFPFLSYYLPITICMKKYLSSKIIVVLIILYLIIYNFISSTGINMNIFNILFWITLAIFSYVLLHYVKSRSIAKKETIQYVIIYCLIYFIFIYALGIVSGFNRLPYSHELINIIKNIGPSLAIIICQELVRYMLIFKNRFSKKRIIFIDILFTITDIIMVVGLYKFNTPLLVFTFIGEALLPSIYNNILETDLSYNTGPIASIVYKIFTRIYVYIVPIIPDLGVYMMSVLNICLPVAILVRVNKLYYDFKNVTRRKVKISEIYITVPLVILLIAMTCLVSGIFRYKIIAIASNSMTPVFSRGDAVIYEKIDDPSKLKVGDILVFKHDNKIITHRITDITYKNKTYEIHTKGDKNKDIDNFTTSDKDVIGVVRQEIKYIGYPTLVINELFD